jgi:hypothetical protein
MQYKSNSRKDLQTEAFKTLLPVLMQKIEAQNELSTPVEASILSLYFVDLCDTKGALGVWGYVCRVSLRAGRTRMPRRRRPPTQQCCHGGSSDDGEPDDGRSLAILPGCRRSTAMLPRHGFHPLTPSSASARAQEEHRDPLLQPCDLVSAAAASLSLASMAATGSDPASLAAANMHGCLILCSSLTSLLWVVMAEQFDINVTRFNNIGYSFGC